MGPHRVQRRRCGCRRGGHHAHSGVDGTLESDKMREPYLTASVGGDYTAPEAWPSGEYPNKRGISAKKE